MSTRYSLPDHGQGIEIARGARALAAVVLVMAVLAFGLITVIVPATDAPLASGAEADASGDAAAYSGA